MVQQAELLRATLLRMAYSCRALEPEDLVHNIILRLLERGALGEDRPPAYWWVAVLNMARDQSRKRQRFVPWSEGFDVRDNTEPETPQLEADVSGLNLAAEELAWLLAYHEAEHSGRIELTKAKGWERTKACRLRKKARAA